MKGKDVYFCLTDWSYELENVPGPHWVYNSVENIINKCKCHESCGIVKAKLSFEEILQPPNPDSENFITMGEASSKEEAHFNAKIEEKLQNIKAYALTRWGLEITDLKYNEENKFIERWRKYKERERRVEENEKTSIGTEDT